VFWLLKIPEPLCLTQPFASIGAALLGAALLGAALIGAALIGASFNMGTDFKISAASNSAVFKIGGVSNNEQIWALRAGEFHLRRLPTRICWSFAGMLTRDLSI
jgi:hypothetical protein